MNANETPLPGKKKKEKSSIHIPSSIIIHRFQFTFKPPFSSPGRQKESIFFTHIFTTSVGRHSRVKKNCNNNKYG